MSDQQAQTDAFDSWLKQAPAAASPNHGKPTQDALAVKQSSGKDPKASFDSWLANNPQPASAPAPATESAPPVPSALDQFEAGAANLYHRAASAFSSAVNGPQEIHFINQNQSPEAIAALQQQKQQQEQANPSAQPLLNVGKFGQKLEGTEFQQEHPYLSGVAQAAASSVGAATSPESLAALAAFAASPETAIPGAIKRLVSAGWSIGQAKGTVQQLTQAYKAYSSGDSKTAGKMLGTGAANAAMAILGTAYAARPGAHEALPAETEPESAPQTAPQEASAPKAAPFSIPTPSFREPEGIGLEDAFEQPQQPQPATQPTTPQSRQTPGQDELNHLDEETGATPIVGPESEPLSAESPETLKAQTEALANGTNPVVYIPQGTPAEDIPDLPDNAMATEVSGNRPGAGLYYHTPDIAPEEIQSAVETGEHGKLLGFSQGKDEATAGQQPTVLVARDADGTELKAAAVDAGNPHAVAAQTDTLRQQFPEAASIGLEHPAETIGARASGRRGEAGFVSGEMLRDIASGNLGREAARQITDKVLKLGDKYNHVRDVDPQIGDQLQELDNAPTYYRAKAEANLGKVTRGLSRSQERLATLMSDTDARENLRLNHPGEYQQALNDPAVMQSVASYKPLADELTRLRKSRGGQVLSRDYLRRVYDEHVAGVGNAKGKGAPESGAQFDRVIRPTKPSTASREASAEYFHEKGLHEFGPSYGAKYVAERISALRDSIARRFMAKATKISSDAELPREIEYNGRTFYRGDIAAEMKRGTPRYSVYDPNRGIRTALVDKETGDATFGRSAYRYLGPREIVDSLTDYDARNKLGPEGSIRNFFRQQIVGLGFGIPHVLNIERRVMQNFRGGALNPKAWAGAFKVALSKTLKEQAINGVDDPRFDALLKSGGMSSGEVSHYKSYVGGNLNPANWASVGHKIIFGKGGWDARARLYVSDLIKSQHPDVSDAELARAINLSLGDYNRANWTNVQKTLAHVLMFPGWDASSFRWILQHPIRTTVPGAVLTLVANQALHHLGHNQGQDATDIGAIHAGDRTFNTGLLNESLARGIYRPALNYAQAKVRGQSTSRANDAATKGFRSAGQTVASKLLPPIQSGIELATNRQSIFGNKEISGRGQSTAKNTAKVLAKGAFPIAEGALDDNQDLAGFGGSHFGVSNYKSDAESRLRRNYAQTKQVADEYSALKKSDPQAAVEFASDPDNRAEITFSKNLSQLSRALNQNTKALADAAKLPNKEKARKLAELNQQRQQILTSADAHDAALEKARQKYQASQRGIPRVPSIPGPKVQAATGAPAPSFQQ